MNDPAFQTLAAFLAGDVPLRDALERLACLACAHMDHCTSAVITLSDGDEVARVGTGGSAGDEASAALTLDVEAPGRTAGRVDFYSDDGKPFEESAVATAHRLAALATMAVTASLTYWREYSMRENLEEALRTRPVIEQAKGIIMATEGCTADEAWHVLRRASQRENRKLRAIAIDFVDNAVSRAQQARTTAAD